MRANSKAEASKSCSDLRRALDPVIWPWGQPQWQSSWC